MNPSEPDSPLSRTLAEWRLTPPANPNFRPAVWQLIRSRGRETWSRYIRAHRVGWSVAVGLTIAAAGWTGRSIAQAKLEAGREKMVVSYLVDLDPRVMAKLPH
jgi:hypothetical protein